MLRIRKFLIKYAWFLAAVLIVLGYFALFRTAEVSGSSMEPTYHNKDLLLMRRVGHIARGDIIAVYSEKMNEILCKRVICIEGDHIVVNSDGLFVNDEKVTEDYVIREDWYTVSATVDYVVPAGEIFVMGDNRVASIDSRVLGSQPVSSVTGVVLFNMTKTFGFRRDALIRAVVVLLVCSLCCDVYKRLHGVTKNKE